jgi:hypothetical protein
MVIAQKEQLCRLNETHFAKNVKRLKKELIKLVQKDHGGKVVFQGYPCFLRKESLNGSKDR